MGDIEKHRKFIHDISNAITVSEGALLSTMESLKDKYGESASVEIEKLLKAQEYLKKVVRDIKDYRSFIADLEKA